MKQAHMFIKFTMSIVFMIVIASCETDTNNNISEFYYYPKTNMYFDVAKNMYIFSLDGAKTWDTIDARTQNEPISLGEKQVIYSLPDSVWKDNEAHRKSYGGSLYNVVDGDSDLVSTATEVTEKKVQKTTTVKKEVDKKPPKKGLGKFLNKIFGKSKDKTEERKPQVREEQR